MYAKIPGSVSLFHMHALLESDYAILRYILHFFTLCRGPKDDFHSTSVFKRCGLLILFFYKHFYLQ